MTGQGRSSTRAAIAVGALIAIGSAVPAFAGGQQTAAGPVPTFTKDVAPILQRSCQNCHRPGSIGPMSLLTYDDARPWARSIKSASSRAPDAAVARRPQRRHASTSSRTIRR